MGAYFYITTPIYYVNDVPHLGHAYTTILADVLARFARLRGAQTFFLTGVDEHGQKVQEAARRLGLDPHVYVEGMYTRFQSTWQALNISNDDFIRTTEPRHVQVVEQVLQDLWEREEIYQGEYQGWYCIPDERFWTEKDLREGACPDCGRPVEKITERNYFFRMSAYQDWLVEYINSHPDFILPLIRRNEVLGFLRQPLGDLCISRPASRLNWGIPLPFDPDFVTYVWFDALLNYVTAAGYIPDQDRFRALWPNALHLIGKDILTTHCVYWPVMLKAAGLPQPKTVFAHGWWVLDGSKMSKSRGKAVLPLDLAGLYGVDALRYFLMRAMAPGSDVEFDEQRLASHYQGDLANNLGNLLHRIVHMINRYCQGNVPKPVAETPGEARLQQLCEALGEQVPGLVEVFAVHQALAQTTEALNAINQYLEQTAPWKRATAGEQDQVATSLYTAAEALRLVSVLLSPVMPGQMAELWRRLGWQAAEPLSDGLQWGKLQPGSLVSSGPPLFPREP